MNRFRSLLISAAVALGGFANAANNVVFADGDPGWRVSDGRCTFLVPGRIVNLSPEGNLSGTLRLCLWVTANPFPSNGYRVATYSLGQLKWGYQYSNISPSTSCSIPKLTGNYHFTVSLEQFDGTYVTADAAGSSLKQLKDGKFVPPRKWKAPSGKVIAPRKKLKVGEDLTFTLQGSEADGSVIYVPNGSQLKLRVKIQANGTTTVYGGSKPEGAPALYTYSTKKDKYGGKTSTVGSITLDYGVFFGVDSKSVYSMFFQKSDKGFYKGTDSDRGAGGNSWGVFSIN